MNDSVLRVHHFLPHSRANGPGVRAVLWVQGCTLACPGCFNPDTHAWTEGEQVPVTALLQRMVALSASIEGLTISGGEPLQQRRALLALLRRVRQETPLSVVLFTGYTWAEVQRMPDAEALLSYVDILITGRYDASQRLARDLCGSANKTVHVLTERYTLAEVQAVPLAEVIITEAGEVIVSGIDPVRW
jgi:anaerobic ribonucleoside-triphosphate reductase activating protein